MGKKLAGARVLFIVRNPSGMGTLINYLTSRKIKTWTISSVKEAPEKILENQIDVVILSSSLKGIKVEKICALLFKEFNVPSIVFSEDTSRKAEADLMRIEVNQKVIPPNHNSKFMEALQSTLGTDLDERVADGPFGVKRQNWLPLNAMPITVDQVPGKGTWIKLDPDAESTPPFTYKLAQPRGTTSGNSRYFYLGDAAPTPSDVSGFFSAERNLNSGGANAEDEDVYDSGEYSRKKKNEIHYEFGNAAEAAKRPNQIDLTSEIADKLKTAGTKNETPTSVIEQALKDAASYINRISSPQIGPVNPPTHFMASLIKTNKSEGYLLTTLTENQVLEATAYSELNEIVKAKLKENGEEVIELTPPLLFEQAMLDFLPWAEASSYYVTSPETKDQNLVYIFVKAPLSEVLLTQSGEDMFSVPLSTMRSDIKLTFDLYVAMPKNNKYLLYARKGTIFAERAIVNFEKHKVNKIFVRREDQNLYYAYRASAFLAEKRKVQGF